MARQGRDGRPHRFADAFRPLPPPDDVRAARRDRRAMLRRALRGRCPLCGTPGLRSGWWSIRERCSGCNFAFRRERGYLVGPAWLSLTVTLALLGIVLVGGAALTAPDIPWTAIGIASFVTVIVVPVLMAPFALAIWLWIDLGYFRPLDADDLGANDPPETGPRADW